MEIKPKLLVLYFRGFMMINRRSFLTLFPLLLCTPTTVTANPLLRLVFRSLFSSSVRYSARTVGRSILRTAGGVKNLSRIQKTFGKKIHKIKNSKGQVVGNAKVENNVLMIRDTQNRILGYIQAEKNLFSVYTGAGKRVISFREKDARIIAYDKDEDYIGQIIKKEIKGQIEDVFIDALGNEHPTVPLELEATTINEERLNIYNDKNEVILYAIKRNDDLILYDTKNKQKGKITKTNGKLYIYNNQKILLQTVSESEQEKIVFNLDRFE